MDHISELSTSRFRYPSGATGVTTAQLDNPRLMKSIDYNTLPKYQAVVNSLGTESITTASLSSYLDSYSTAIQDDEFELSIFNDRKYNYAADMLKMFPSNTSYICNDYVTNVLPSIATPYVSSDSVETKFRDLGGSKNVKTISVATYNIDLNYFDFFAPTTISTTTSDEHPINPDPYSTGTYPSRKCPPNSNSYLHFFRDAINHCTTVYFIGYDDVGITSTSISTNTVCILNVDNDIGKNCFPIYVETLSPSARPNQAIAKPCIKIQLPIRSAQAMANGPTKDDIEKHWDQYKIHLDNITFIT